jgi:endo-1,4-beta-xylanase
MDTGITRRTVLKGAAGAAAGAALSGTLAETALAARKPLWRVAQSNGIAYGAAIASWMLEDDEYMALVKRQASIIFTQDDFLWYVLKPSRDAPVSFEASDKIVEKAEANKQLVFGAHLVWDEGFGEGWGEDEMFNLSKAEAEEILYGTVEATVNKYKGRIAGWIVVNEGISNEGCGPTTPGTRRSAASTWRSRSGSSARSTRTPCSSSTSSASRPPTSSATSRARAARPRSR